MTNSERNYQLNRDRDYYSDHLVSDGVAPRDCGRGIRMMNSEVVTDYSPSNLSGVEPYCSGPVEPSRSSESGELQ